MRLGLVILLASAGWVLFASAPARANDCVIHPGPQAGMGEQLLSIFSWFRDVAVRECSTAQGEKTYYVLTKPRQTRFGVCQYDDFPMDKSPNIRRVLMMAPPQPICPPAAAAAYSVTSNVTPGTFLALAQYWDRLAKHPALLDKALEDLKQLPLLQELQSALEAKQPMRLAAVWLQTRSDGTPPHYVLTLRSQTAAWSLLVDEGPKGLEIIGADTAR